MSDEGGDAVAIEPLGGGRYLITRGDIRRVAYAAVGRDTWVFLDGHAYVIGRSTARSSRSRLETADQVTAPMPATVLAIHAAAGQRVAKDEVVIVIEAMKMELPIRAPRDGTVARVACSVGELVQPGTTLMELEDLEF